MLFHTKQFLPYRQLGIREEGSRLIVSLFYWVFSDLQRNVVVALDGVFSQGSLLDAARTGIVKK